MPVKRRTAKGRHTYSPTIESLLDGVPVPRTAEVREELIGIWYFGWSDRGMPAEAIPLAGAALAAWEEVSCP